VRRVVEPGSGLEFTHRDVSIPSSPEEFRSWLGKDAERWARVIKAAGVTAD
jgi:hypothetical protein